MAADKDMTPVSRCAYRRSARRMVPGFSPKRNGFRFPNSWPPDLPAMTVGLIWNRLLDSLPEMARNSLQIARVDENWLPLTHADAGLCGGMVFSVMDYWQKGQRPPIVSRAPQSATQPLFIHVRDRQWDSFDVAGGGYRFIAYSSPLYPNGDEGVIQVMGLARGRSWVTYRDEWPKIRNDLDAGQLSPLGLVQTDSLDIGKNHQVLAFGYEQSGQQVTMFIYDPNYPGVTTEFSFDITDTSGEVHIGRTTTNTSGSSACSAWTDTPRGTLSADGRDARLPSPRSRAGPRTAIARCSSPAVTGRSGRTSGPSPTPPTGSAGSRSATTPSPKAPPSPRSRPGPRTAIARCSSAAVTGRSGRTSGPSPTPPTGSAGSRSVRTRSPKAPPSPAIKTRAEDGHCTLFVSGSDGKVWTNFWPKPDTTDWFGWFPIGENTFPEGTPVTAIKTRAEDGHCTLFVSGSDGKVWTNFWPKPDTTDWFGWFPVGENTFPEGTPVTAIKTRAEDGHCTLFVSGSDGKVWTNFWPKPDTTDWFGWFPIGDNAFPEGTPVTAIKTRAEDGHCTLFVTGSDGKVWTNFWPKPDTTDWFGWFPIGENTFPEGTPVTAIKTRAEDGHCTLFVTGSDGKVWTNFWPKPDTTDWFGWFPVGENTFPVAQR